MIRLISRSLAIATVLITLASLGASAQDARLAARLDTRTAGAVTRVVDSARALSLPTEPLVQKALQGSAKRAPSERVIAAVHELLGELSAARAALGAQSSEAELVAGAGALHAGITRETLSRIRALRGTQSVTVALATLADLVARGVPVDVAVNTVLALTARGAADSDLLAFSAQVGRDIVAGAPPAVAARVRGAAAGRAIAPPAGGRPTVPARRPATPGQPAGGGRPVVPAQPGHP